LSLIHPLSFAPQSVSFPHRAISIIQQPLPAFASVAPAQLSFHYDDHDYYLLLPFGPGPNTPQP
jgi:hypothetical protein